MARHTSQRLGEMFAEMLEQARETGRPQKLGLAKGALLRLTVRNRRVELLVARCGAPLTFEDLALAEGQCQVPRTARRRPATGQHRQEIGGQVYFAIAFAWSLW
ncbi:MAG TPA: hypothetical protein PKK15_11975 [Kouleothrix sp.]|nr:hypothetical protein [Kouleothrix sp.]